jgi:putative FmdB family regulatory protein
LPLYEYHCPACGSFEVIQKFSDAPLTSCPTCQREVQKQLSAPAFQFKGTGWYITDYARKGNGASKKDGAEGKASEAKSEGKSESKAAEAAPASSTVKSE